jgi:hypothetical protein
MPAAQLYFKPLARMMATPIYVAVQRVAVQHECNLNARVAFGPAGVVLHGLCEFAESRH